MLSGLYYPQCGCYRGWHKGSELRAAAHTIRAQPVYQELHLSHTEVGKVKAAIICFVRHFLLYPLSSQEVTHKTLIYDDTSFLQTCDK